MIWGAGRAAWAHFSLVLGLTEDLLPVVSNPHATISVGSKLHGLGKVPSRYNGAGHVVGLVKWTQRKSTAQQISQWSENDDYGICIQTRQLAALDFDLERGADQLLDQLRELLHVQLAVRIRDNSARCLTVFKIDQPVSKSVVRLEHGIIELLGAGQQFIAAGTHPSGARYEWAGGFPAEIPEINTAQLGAVWRELGGDFQGVQQRRSVHVGAGSTRHLHEPSHSDSDGVAAWLERRGWVRESDRVREPQRLLIHCPWAIDHSGDSGATETIYYLPGGGYESGHFKCLHAHCAERTDGDFLEAIGFNQSLIDDFPIEPDPAAPIDLGNPAQTYTVTVAAPVVFQPVVVRAGPTYSSVADWATAGPGLGLRRKKGRWEAVIDNVVRALDTGGFWRRVGYDRFRQEIMHCGWNESNGDEQWLELTDRDLTAGRLELERAGFQPVGRELIRDAVELVAHRAEFDSAQEWLSRLRWDGVARVGKFLETYCGAEGGNYSSAVSAYMWTAMAGRVITPGVQADMVPILVGVQGIGKTRGVEALVPDPLTQCVTIDLSDRDADISRLARGRLILELSELRGLHTKDKTAIKSFITQRADSWIPKYREFSVSAPRRWFAVGTTDADEFLDDEAGDRRWLPVGCRGVDVARVAADRSQLWAEGAARYLIEGVLWKAAHELAGPAREQYLMSDAWDAEISDWLKKRENNSPFSTRDAALGIGLDPRNSNRATEMRLAKILRRLGLTKVRQSSIGLGRKYLWQSQG